MVGGYFEKKKIEEYYPDAYMIPPMKAWKLPKNKQDAREKVFENRNYFAETKIDGACYTFEHTPQGNTYLFSRTVSAKNGLLVNKADRVPHLIEEMKSVFPAGTVVALEVYIPTGKAKDVVSFLGCLPAKAIKRQQEDERGFLRAYIHDILVYQNKNTMIKSALDRIELLTKIYKETDHTDIAIPVMNNIEGLLADCLDQGYEGIILKKCLGAYYPDKRPAWEWIKIKPEVTYDVICTGFDSPTKEYKGKTDLKDWKYWESDTPVTKPYSKGWVGSLKIGCYKNDEIFEIGNIASGLSDVILEKIKMSPDSFIGKPVEVEAMEATEDLKLREGRFLRFRDDISPKDCNFNKIFM